MKSLLAAISLFTRVPVARFLPENYLGREHYGRAIVWWPVVGLLVGLVVALVLFLLGKIFPIYIAVLVTIAVRVLLTGAMHEDGLADFCDGFGGGASAGSATNASTTSAYENNEASQSADNSRATENEASTSTADYGIASEGERASREKILAIMKDSYIGTYGVIALILYFLLLTSEIGTISAIDMRSAVVAIVSAEFISRAASLWLVGTLPYARSEEESKIGFLYTKPSDAELVVMSLVSIAPLIIFLGVDMLVTLILPIIGIFLLRNYIKRKIGGYTGDCCGASVLIIEQLFYLGFIILFVIWR